MSKAKHDGGGEGKANPSDEGTDRLILLGVYLSIMSVIQLGKDRGVLSQDQLLDLSDIADQIRVKISFKKTPAQ